MQASPFVVLPPPPTTNARSSQERSALVRSSRKLYRLLGDVPSVPDDDDDDVAPPAGVELKRTMTNASVDSTKSIWRKRKPTHVPPPLMLSNPSADALSNLDSPAYYDRASSHRGSVLSVAPSITSNAPGSSTSDAHRSDIAQRRTKLERLRRKLGNEVPPTAVFPATPSTAVPHPPKTPNLSRKPSRSRTRSVAHPADARSVTISISSDEGVHTATFTARVRSPRSNNTFQVGPLPPVPSVPTQLLGDDTGLVRPRQKMAAGSRIGGADFKAARKVKREGARSRNGRAEPGEMVEMVGFLF